MTQGHWQTRGRGSERAWRMEGIYSFSAWRRFRQKSIYCEFRFMRFSTRYFPGMADLRLQGRGSLHSPLKAFLEELLPTPTSCPPMKVTTSQFVAARMKESTEGEGVVKENHHRTFYMIGLYMFL